MRIATQEDEGGRGGVRDNMEVCVMAQSKEIPKVDIADVDIEMLDSSRML